MIFLGDTAVPSAFIKEFSEAMDLLPYGNVILNLEGGICLPENEKTQKGVFNAKALLSVLPQKHVVAAMLANNHINDFGESNVDATEAALKQEGVGIIGLRETPPFVLTENGVQTAHIGFGWNYVRCRSRRIHKLSRENVLKQIAECRARVPAAKIVVHFHWDFELEAYPMPAQRALAREIIEQHGVSLIIGHHPHRVQGIEYFIGGAVCYSLGNWFFPQGVFYGGRSKFPDVARTILALEWKPKQNGMGDLVPHWFSQQKDNSLKKISPKDTPVLADYAPFSKQTDSEYTCWFRKNRQKNLFLPVMTEKDGCFANAFCFLWIKIREKMIFMIVFVKKILK